MAQVNVWSVAPSMQVPLNGADDFLHLVLGIGMIGLGVALTRRVTAGPRKPKACEIPVTPLSSAAASG